MFSTHFHYQLDYQVVIPRFEDTFFFIFSLLSAYQFKFNNLLVYHFYLWPILFVLKSLLYLPRHNRECRCPNVGVVGLLLQSVVHVKDAANAVLFALNAD